jgi:outer membrane protein assembly factor BamB
MAIEGEPVPGAKAVKHFESGQEFIHPDGVGANRTQTLEVLALAAGSGKPLWERVVWEGAPYDSRHKRGSFASPTPVSDGTLAYAYFGAEGLYALDFQGNLAWKWWPGALASFGVGVGTSPLIQVSWATPVLVKAGERDELVTAGNEHVIAYDPATGRELWHLFAIGS